jgi:hypothetical protein
MLNPDSVCRERALSYLVRCVDDKHNLLVREIKRLDDQLPWNRWDKNQFQLIKQKLENIQEELVEAMRVAEIILCESFNDTFDRLKISIGELNSRLRCFDYSKMN